MALINCTKCGREFSNKEGDCPYCGYPIAKYDDDEPMRTSNNKISSFRIRIIIMVFAALIIIIIASTYFVRQISKYNNAEQFYKSNNYESALVLFNELGSFKNSKEYVEKINSKIAIVKYKQALNLINSDEIDDLLKAEQNLREIGEYKDSKNKLEICIKNIALYYYDDYDIANAMTYFKKCTNIKADDKLYDEYKNIKLLYSIMGEWLSDDRSGGIIIEGNTGYWLQFSKSSGLIINRRIPLVFKYGNISDDKEYIVAINNDYGKLRFYNEKGKVKMVRVDSISDTTFYFEKYDISDNLAVKPSIGMTKEDVRASTWGSPNKINKTTYSWGTNEQWCYSNYRYIYFENGIVTSISE